MTAVVAVLALVGGLLGWSLSSAQAPRKDAAPFYDAAINLATAPMIHYAGSSAASDSSWDMWVTSGGEQSGTFTTTGEQYGVLTVGGVTYVKPPQSDLALLNTNIPVADLQGRWLAGDSDVTSLLPGSLLTPEALATKLFAGFGHGATFPVVGAPTVRVGGRQALKAVMPDGIVYITATAPYQVLQVGPPAQARTTATSVFGSPAARNADTAEATDAAYGTDAASASALGQTSLEPATQAAIDQTYGSLIDQTNTLNNAPDIGIDTEYNETGNLNCSDTDCTVDESVTTSTTSTQPASLSGSVSAVMTATVTVDGEPGGGCTQTQTLPINGTSTMTCDDPGVAGDVAQIQAQEQEEADAEGQDLDYTIDFLADVEIEAMADVEAEVTQQVDAEQAEQNAADQEAQQEQDESSCPANSFVAGTRVLMADGSTEPIQDVGAGDQVENSDPDSPVVQQHTVTARHVTTTDRHFVHLSIAAPHGAGGTVDVTADHLFYDTTTGAWTDAVDLKPGDHLQTPGDGTAIVDSVRPYGTVTTTYNLTVDDVHTYFVTAGTTPVLVHNCPSASPGATPAATATAANAGQALGAAREAYVAKLTGGTVATDENGQGMLVTQPNVGTTDVDVIGPNGEYIGVGGAAKARNPAQFGKSLSILKWAADQAGVPAQYYFADGTPEATINQAKKALGANNVFTFDMG